MRIRVHDPAFTDDLLEFLRRVGCLAVRLDSQTIDVHLLNSVSERYDRQELNAYLKAWQAMHPGIAVEATDP